MSTAPRIVVFGLSNWLGAPRLPRAFQQAGFEVAVVHGEQTLLGLTRFANRRYEVKDGTQERVVYAVLWELVLDWGASSIIGTDELSLRVLHDLARAVEGGQLDHLEGHDAFRAMLARCLPPVPQLPALASKQGGHALAVAAKVPVPVQEAVPSLEAALAFAEQHGYPVVLKPDRGASGSGVVICPDAAVLERAHAKLSALAANNAVLAEAFVAGAQVSHVLVAQHGRLLCGFTRRKLRAYPNANSPSSVVELVDVPAVAEAAAHFVAECGYSGFGSMQFLEGADGVARFIEFNPRPVPMSHMGEALVGVDGCRAWFAAMDRRLPPVFAQPVAGQRIALFPQEWLRDANSADLRGEALADVPWDDLPLLQGYLRLRR